MALCCSITIMKTNTEVLLTSHFSLLFVFFPPLNCIFPSQYHFDLNCRNRNLPEEKSGTTYTFNATDLDSLAWRMRVREKRGRERERQTDLLRKFSSELRRCVLGSIIKVDYV